MSFLLNNLTFPFNVQHTMLLVLNKAICISFQSSQSLRKGEVPQTFLSFLLKLTGSYLLLNLAWMQIKV